MSRRSRWLTGAILRPAEAGANVIVTMTVGSGTALSGVVPPTLALNKSLGTAATATGGWTSSQLESYTAAGDPVDVSSYGSFTFTGTTLTWNAVPEPTSALAGLLLAAGSLRRHRGA